jgi:2-polyprenyl-6-methoxyphenol hydroxylase-like FAD-dependent oxidoreductase
VPVLIVGGSLVGLSTALFLRLHGVDVLAVERHAGTAIHSRAGHFHLRTALEPMLRARATELGARLRYGTECVSLEQDADGVTAVIRDLASGTDSLVRARYVVAADGNRSPIRERLGIGMHGHGLLSHSITIYFRALADLGPLLRDRNPGRSGTATTPPPSYSSQAPIRCTNIPASRRDGRARVRRTSSSTGAARCCPRSTCSAGTSSCWPGRRAMPGMARLSPWRKSSVSGWTPTGWVRAILPILREISPHRSG